jgi:hypothetical protein
MALKGGAKKLFEWLKQQSAGAIVSYEEVMEAANWSEVSLKPTSTRTRLPFSTKTENDISRFF